MIEKETKGTEERCEPASLSLRERRDVIIIFIFIFFKRQTQIRILSVIYVLCTRVVSETLMEPQSVFSNFLVVITL